MSLKITFSSFFSPSADMEIKIILLLTNSSPLLWTAWTKFVSNCFALSGFLGRAPDRQREAATCDVVWKVTPLLLHTVAPLNNTREPESAAGVYDSDSWKTELPGFTWLSVNSPVTIVFIFITCQMYFNHGWPRHRYNNQERTFGHTEKVTFQLQQGVTRPE